MNFSKGIIISVFTLVACNNTDKKVGGTSDNAAVQNTTTSTPATSASLLTVPQFKDPEIQKYFNWHSRYLQNYLEAVRKNDKSAIKEIFDDAATKTDEAISIVEKAKLDPEEYKKLQDYTKQTRPILREVGKSPYVRELTSAYMAKQK